MIIQGITVKYKMKKIQDYNVVCLYCWQAIINDILDGIDDSYEVDITLDRQLAIETAVITLGDNECLFSKISKVFAIIYHYNR
jgi:hypothetical protein